MPEVLKGPAAGCREPRDTPEVRLRGSKSFRAGQQQRLTYFQNAEAVPTCCC